MRTDAQVGAKVTGRFVAEVVAINDDLGTITLKGNTKGATHIDWTWDVHWATEFDTVEAPAMVIPERLGAVVETDGGETHRFLFDGIDDPSGGAVWWQPKTGMRLTTAALRGIAVRVLSEGVPDA